MTGKKWFYSFKKKHPNLSYREPQSMSLARAKGFDKENVLHLFNLLTKIIGGNICNATRIYNVNKSGFSTVQKRCQKFLR